MKLLFFILGYVIIFLLHEHITVVGEIFVQDTLVIKFVRFVVFVGTLYPQKYFILKFYLHIIIYTHVHF